MTCSRCFNPRAHAGRDNVASDAATFDGVSIHAPTRGATGAWTFPAHEHGGFQSTRPRGARRTWPRTPPRSTAFQSTRPRGARQCLRCGHTWLPRFNPRAHAGRDAECRANVAPHPLFQSTRPRGARPGGLAERRAREKVSIHAPTRGATAGYVEIGPVDKFQSTRPRGARPLSSPAAVILLNVSIHAPTRGATPILPVRGATRPSFNPRAHAGRDNQALNTPQCFSGFNPRAHAGRDATTTTPGSQR